jgi:cob(I)alamin adenosyltransferase
MGLVQIYTGPGKGKTTAALGLGFRALGHGFNVAVIQFLKGRDDSGEVLMAAHTPGFSITRFGSAAFVDKSNPGEEDRREARRGLEFAHSLLDGGACDLLVLDEINVALDFGLLEEKEVLELMEKGSLKGDLVLTGRNASPALIEKADLVTEMKEIKHPFTRGMTARKGIEF